MRDITGSPKRKEAALLELARQREALAGSELAKLVWSYPGVLPALIKELVSVYNCTEAEPTVSCPDPGTSTRVCNSLTLLQCVASCKDTRGDFIEAAVPKLVLPLIGVEGKVSWKLVLPLIGVEGKVSWKLMVLLLIGVEGKVSFG